MEKEKQVKQLHKNVSALKVNLEKAHTVFELKAKNQLNDNEHLLKEVNDMRHEVRKLSLDNLRLKADLYEATRKRNPRVALSSTLPLGMRSKETYGTAARSHFEGGGEDYSFDKLNEFPDSTKSSPSTREGGDSDFRSKYGDISDNSDSVELSSIAPTSANEKISKIVFPNEKVIRSERIARDKRLLSDGSCVAQDILTFHQQRGRGETGSPSYLTPESDINIASPGKHSASLQTNLTLHTNNLHLPAVMKQSTRVGK